MTKLRNNINDFIVYYQLDGFIKIATCWILVIPVELKYNFFTVVTVTLINCCITCEIIHVIIDVTNFD